MTNVFEITDKTGRKVILTKNRLSHIRKDHPLVEEEDIKEALINPDKIVHDERENIELFYKYFQHKKQVS